jgi:hypothetical protein
MFPIKAFVRGYIDCALWASVDETGEPLDDICDASDIAPDCYRAMKADCYDFIRSNFADLCAYAERLTEDSAGHNFWLTRNGHGAGFWDRGLGELGDRLSDASRPYGSVDLFVDDEGIVNSLNSTQSKSGSRRAGRHSLSTGMILACMMPT